MNVQESMIVDYALTGGTVGRHPMAHYRDELCAMQVTCSAYLARLRHGVHANIAGCVIAR